jgi:hypothetical protein
VTDGKPSERSRSGLLLTGAGFKDDRDVCILGKLGCTVRITALFLRECYGAQGCE